MCNFFRKNLCYSKINILRNSKDKNLKICNVELDTKSPTAHILSFTLRVQILMYKENSR